jgi:glycerol-3-phosphate O-acyltransferase / dihydroxyacetone phosphate acyltransferase
MRRRKHNPNSPNISPSVHLSSPSISKSTNTTSISTHSSPESTSNLHSPVLHPTAHLSPNSQLSCEHLPPPLDINRNHSPRLPPTAASAAVTPRIEYRVVTPRTRTQLNAACREARANLPVSRRRKLKPTEWVQLSTFDQFIMCCTSIVRFLLSLIVKLFFREVDAFNASNVPPDGPVIFVCAPHANQFIDPLVVQSQTNRQVGFLAAQKSVDKKYVGKLIQAMGSIPVKRAQDYKKRLAGTVTSQGASVYGQGTSFVQEFGNRQSIFISAARGIFRVAEVVSDTELTLAEPLENDVVEASNHSSVPRLDQSDMFSRVWEELAAGNAVGIFPEGGSHDRTELLPLKAGVSIMALGAMAKYEGLDVKIVPCGLNYYAAHRFRSRAYVDFGDPISVPLEFVDMFRKGGADKRAACSQLLDIIYEGLQSVTVEASDYETLQFVRQVRRLYHPRGKKISARERLELQRRFASAYQQFGDIPEVQAIRAQVTDYADQCKYFNLKDHQVKRLSERMPCYRAVAIFIWRIFKLLVLGTLALPGVILWSPVSITAEIMSARKAQEAASASTVKIAGRDVLATWKVMVALVLVPVLHVVYTVIAAIVTSNIDPEPADWLKIAIPIATLFCLSFIGYGTIIFTETSIMILRSLRPLMWAACHCCCCLGRQQQQQLTLQQRREELRHSITELVQELGPKLLADGDADAFNKWRIVQPHETDDVKQNINSLSVHSG